MEQRVLLSKGREGTVVSFMVAPVAWTEPANEQVFRKLGQEIAPSVGGLPLTIRLVDGSFRTRKEIKLD
jgi:hypothetical protein